ncbi:MAG TPA: SURF1 family protein [Anaerolineaceae bacterium]|nr:SURF1 family protein [Anaerolineaceae bacterium]
MNKNPVWRQLLTWRWVLTTLLAITAVLAMVRLGFWQLDRLEQRREYNASVRVQIERAPLDLNAHASDPNLTNIEYRRVTARGTYDFSQQVILRNQVYNGQAGMDLLTPLRIEGTDQAVLVDRGWIPLEDLAREQWKKYDEPGLITLTGIFRSSQTASNPLGQTDPKEGRLDAFIFANLERIQKQVDLPLLPMYIQQTSGGKPADGGLPARTEPVFDLSEGPHEGYAIQWFTFAAILAAGYPFYVRSRLAGKPARKTTHPGLNQKTLIKK